MGQFRCNIAMFSVAPLKQSKHVAETTGLSAVEHVNRDSAFASAKIKFGENIWL